MFLLSFVLGVLHGMGIDHLMAICNLVNRKSRLKNASMVGVSFGIGHIGVLFFVGVVGLLFNLTFPIWLEKSAEMFGGALLIILGLWTFSFFLQNKAHTHNHTHNHLPHDHTHFHLFNNGHEHTHSLLLGGLFATSGLRFLLIMVPIILAQTMLHATLNILIFGAGIVISMGLFGFIISLFYGLTRKISLLHKLVMFFTAYLSITTGILWIMYL